MIKFNINDEVGIKLTKEGLDFLRQEYENFWNFSGRLPPYPYREPMPDSNGIYWFTFWGIMEKLAPTFLPTTAYPLIENCEIFLRDENLTPIPVVIDGQDKP